MYNRNLRKPSPNKNIYRFASAKAGRTLDLESSLEFDLCFHLEYSKDVIDFEAQPKGFYYEFDSRGCPYTPDFEVKYLNRTVLIETKEFKDKSVPEFKARFAAKVSKAKELGKQLILVTERQIRIDPILNNLKLLHRHTGISSGSSLQNEIIRTVSEVGLTPLVELTKRFDLSPGELKENCLAVIGKGKLESNLDEVEFGLSSLIWLPAMSPSIGGSHPTPFICELNKELPIQNVEIREYKNGKLSDAVLVKRDLDSFPTEQKEKALKKFKLLSLINSELDGGWTEKKLTPLINKYAPQVGLNVSNWRTVARWWRKYNLSGGEITALAANDHRKGNRNPKVVGDEAFFHDALARFLSTKRPSYAKAYEFYHDRIVVANESLVEGKVPMVSYEAFRKRILKQPPYQVAVARHGKKLADIWFGYFDAHKPPTRVLERVEIDH